MQTSDIFIVGGGINGVGIARDATGRGLTVTLAEQHDLASHTSSASSKLIHGGLRYLEHYEFRLVRESLHEREVLLKTAPHLVHARRFVLPHRAGMRPAFILRLGLFLYDHIGGRETLPPTRTLNLVKAPEGAPLVPGFRTGFEYSDCWVDDARLVVLSALDAAERGATILKGHKVISADHQDGLWQISVEGPTGEVTVHRARALVNATGPWVNLFRSRLLPAQDIHHKIRLVKGSHIIVPALYDGAQAYTLQNADGRVVFVIPYEGRYTLIGTTEAAFLGDPADAAISDEEITYLCESASAYFRKMVSPADVVWTYSGVRPLADDSGETMSRASRDYVLDLIAGDGAPPMLNIYGGKLTTYRKLAEAAMAKLAPVIGCNAGPWTASSPLPGGDMGDFDVFSKDLAQAFGWLDPSVTDRLARAYGTRVYELLGQAEKPSDLGQHFGGGLYEAELDYMRRREWATTAEDMLWRRSKLGLHLSDTERAAVALWAEKT